MNKKQFGTVIAAGVLTLGLATSYAYFNATTSAIGGNGEGNLAALTITNGRVAVSAKATGQTGVTADWSYDVVKYSAGGYENVTDEELIEFQNQHRSPDINATTKSMVTIGGSELSRAVIGAALPASIQYTRPGDAIVLGTLNSDGTGGGLQVTNDSNLTVKIQLVVKTGEDAKTELEKLTDAGWVMYVDGKVVPFESGNIVDLGVVGPDTDSSKLVDVRFELPLTAGNDYQGKGDSTVSVSDLNLSNLIEIQATQENNSGWNQDGSGNTITDIEETNGKTQE